MSPDRRLEVLTKLAEDRPPGLVPILAATGGGIGAGTIVGSLLGRALGKKFKHSKWRLPILAALSSGAALGTAHVTSSALSRLNEYNRRNK